MTLHTSRLEIAWCKEHIVTEEACRQFFLNRLGIWVHSKAQGVQQGLCSAVQTYSMPANSSGSEKGTGPF